MEVYLMCLVNIIDMCILKSRVSRYREIVSLYFNCV